MSDDKPDNVSAIVVDSQSPEGVLRNVLSQVAALRAEGLPPYVLVLYGAEGRAASCVGTDMYPADILMCKARLDILADDEVRDMYTDIGGEG